jgi:hypothetical protein
VADATAFKQRFANASEGRAVAGRHLSGLAVSGRSPGVALRGRRVQGDSRILCRSDVVFARTLCPPRRTMVSRVLFQRTCRRPEIHGEVQRREV